MSARLFTDINKRNKNGDSQRFIKHGKGFFSLAFSSDNDLIKQIGNHKKKIAKKLRNLLFELTADEFEKLILNLLYKLGYEDVSQTAFSGDGGIDVRATMVTGDVIRTKMAVQAKRWHNNVGAPIVQQVRGSLSTHEQGLIITTSDFSKSAYAEANQVDKTPIALMNGDTLVSLLMDLGIGVKKTATTVYELDNKESLLE